MAPGPARDPGFGPSPALEPGFGPGLALELVPAPVSV